MQKTKFRQFVNSVGIFINPIVSETWSNRSILVLSLLFGFYSTNSTLSYLLDKSVNKTFIAIIIILIMEITIRSSLIPKFSKLSIIINSINNFRIGSTYALILEAFKLGS